MQCHVVVLEGENNEVHLVSPFSREELKTTQSRSELFVGHLLEPSIGVVPGNIAYNKDFLVHVHSLVREIMVNDPEVLARAQEQPNGFVFIVDRRSPASFDSAQDDTRKDDKVDKEDIIGIFVCHERTTDPSRYRPNPDYLLISEKGPAQFPEAVEAELRKLLS